MRLKIIIPATLSAKGRESRHYLLRRHDIDVHDLLCGLFVLWNVMATEDVYEIHQRVSDYFFEKLDTQPHDFRTHMRIVGLLTKTLTIMFAEMHLGIHPIVAAVEERYQTPTLSFERMVGIDLLVRLDFPENT